MTNESALVFVCFEADCEEQFVAQSEEQLIADVNAHMSSAHKTFEMEEVILANATRT